MKKIIIILLFISTLSGFATVFQVPTTNFPTIQSAVDAASPGDTVGMLRGNVFMGTGNMNVTIPIPLNIIAMGSGGSNPRIQVNSGGLHATIFNFLPSSPSGLVKIENIIFSNSFGFPILRGIEMLNTAHFDIIITGCTFRYLLSGIRIEESHNNHPSVIIIEKNRFENNRDPLRLNLDNASFTFIERNEFSNFSANSPFSVSDIFLAGREGNDAGTVIINENKFSRTNNQTTNSFAINSTNTSQLQITNNELTNYVYSDVNGIISIGLSTTLATAQATIKGNTIDNNTSDVSFPITKLIDITAGSSVTYTSNPVVDISDNIIKPSTHSGLSVTIDVTPTSLGLVGLANNNIDLGASDPADFAFQTGNYNIPSSYVELPSAISIGDYHLTSNGPDVNLLSNTNLLDDQDGYMRTNPFNPSELFDVGCYEHRSYGTTYPVRIHPNHIVGPGNSITTRVVSNPGDETYIIIGFPATIAITTPFGNSLIDLNLPFIIQPIGTTNANGLAELDFIPPTSNFSGKLVIQAINVSSTTSNLTFGTGYTIEIP